MRLPVVMAHEAVYEGQCLGFFAQPPLCGPPKALLGAHTLSTLSII